MRFVWLGKLTVVGKAMEKGVVKVVKFGILIEFC